MTPEERQKAEEVAAMNRDLKQLVYSYNGHKRSAEDYRDPNHYFRDVIKFPAWGPAKCDAQADWHFYIFTLVQKQLERKGLFVTVPSFFDDTEFELPEAPGLIIKKTNAGEFEIVKDPYNMEEHMANSALVLQKVKDDVFAQQLYAAMCNVSWLKNNVEWSVSWRTSGGLVADLRNVGEDYMDFYCSGIGGNGNTNEGEVTDDVLDTLATLGWAPDPTDIARNLGQAVP